MPLYACAEERELPSRLRGPQHLPMTTDFVLLLPTPADDR